MSFLETVESPSVAAISKSFLQDNLQDNLPAGKKYALLKITYIKIFNNYNAYDHYIYIISYKLKCMLADFKPAQCINAHAVARARADRPIAIYH